MANFGPIAATILIAILFALSGVMWIAVIFRLRRGEILLEFQRRSQVPWGLLDIFLVLMLLPLLGSVANSIALTKLEVPTNLPLDELPPDSMIAVLFAGSIAKLAVIVIALPVILWKNKATMAQLGWPGRSMNNDFEIGVIGFLLLVGPVLSIQAALASFWPSEHPLIELLVENSGPIFFLVSGFSAVIVAPIAEEFIFRVLLQGWFEKLAQFRGDPAELLFGHFPTFAVVANNEDSPKASEIDRTNSSAAFHKEHGKAEQLERGSPSAIVASAAIFALMHFSHGPDPIPLFFFALGLGYLYQRTNRVLPCIIVHLLLNALSLANIYLGTVGQ